MQETDSLDCNYRFELQVECEPVGFFFRWDHWVGSPIVPYFHRGDIKGAHPWIMKLIRVENRREHMGISTFKFI